MISVMLEKDKGKLLIFRLKIIKMLEYDLSFLLALVFGHLFINLSRKHKLLKQKQYGIFNVKQNQYDFLNKILSYDIFFSQKITG